MEIFNIGILEAVFILLLMLVLLGPEGMIKTARSVAVNVRKFLHSPYWAAFKRAFQDAQEMPTRLMREAGIDEIEKEITAAKRELTDNRRGAVEWNAYYPDQPQTNTIQPPRPVDSQIPAEPAAPETSRQVYRRTTAAHRKTRQPVIYPQQVILPPGNTGEDANGRPNNPNA